MQTRSISWLVAGCLLLFSAVSCSSRAGASGGKEDWQNPVITCQLKDQEDPVQQYPASGPASAGKLADFCNRTQKRFSQSQVSQAEAVNVYQLLLQARLLNDAAYGMPGPGVSPAKSLTLQDYQRRIAIRKISENQYELFYSYTNCGTNYEHSRIAITSGRVGQPERIEAWSGSFPC